MLNHFRSYLPLFFLLFLVACSQVDEPELSDIRAQLQKNLPEPWLIESIDVAAEENIGSKTEPAWQYRIVVEMAPEENLYKWLAKPSETHVLKVMREKGDEKSVHIISKSIFKNGQWQHYFKYDANPFKGEGQVAQYWTRRSGEYVIYGSSEYEQLIQKTQKGLKEIEERLEQTKLELSDLKKKQDIMIKELRQQEKLKIQKIREEYATYQTKIGAFNSKLFAKKQAVRTKERPVFDQKIRQIDTDNKKETRAIFAKYKSLEKVVLNKINKMDKQKRNQRTAIFNKYNKQMKNASGDKKADLKDAMNNELADLDALYKQKTEPLQSDYRKVLKQRDQEVSEKYKASMKKIDALNKEYAALEKKHHKEIVSQYESEKQAIEAPYKQAQNNLDAIRKEFQKKNDKLNEEYRNKNILLGALNLMLKENRQALVDLSQIK